MTKKRCKKPRIIYKCKNHPEIKLHIKLRDKRRKLRWYFVSCYKCDDLQHLQFILSKIEQRKTEMREARQELKNYFNDNFLQEKYLEKLENSKSYKDLSLRLLTCLMENRDIWGKIREQKKQEFFEIPGTYNPELNIFLVY